MSQENKVSDFALVIFATLVGLGVRLGPVLNAHFPLNDGGLFYAMIQGLRANNYLLPKFVHFNGGDIPFAYPPLGFYLTSLFSDFTRLDLLDVMRWLPSIVSALAIPAFYFLARKLSSSRSVPALAALIFALTPGNFAWLVMGGGVTRSFGMVFALVTLTFIHRLFTAPTRGVIFWTSVWSAITIVTHPEAGLQTAFAALLLFLFYDRSLRGVGNSLVVTTLTVVLTAPWWGQVIAAHGWDPFVAATSAVGSNSIPVLLRPFVLIQFTFTEEPYLKIIAALGMIGFFYQLYKREYFLPAWLILAYVFEPRSAPQFMAIPISILAATALARMILPRLANIARSSGTLTELLGNGSSRLFFGFLFIIMSMGAFITTNKLVTEHSLASTDLEAMQWIRDNTAPDSHFAILTGKIALFDATTEWLPVVTGRVSVATAFGYEWVNDGQFGRRVEAYDALQACMSKELDCLETWGRDYGLAFTHILIRNGQNGKVVIAPIQVYLNQSSEYTLLFRTPEISIYALNQP